MKNATLQDQLVHEVWRQDTAAIKRLLDAGANPNLPGHAWSSAIACAGENDETGNILRLLVARGANINLQNANGLTPLHYAVDVAIDGNNQTGGDAIDWSAVDAALSLGADPTIPDKHGKTVYDLAADYGFKARKSFQDFMNSRYSDGQRT